MADVFALTSLSEGFGNVIVEAMYAGLPVVCTDCPSGPREILDGGRFGKLITVGDERALVEALRYSLDTSIDKEAIISRAKHFNVTRICEAYLALAAEKYSHGY